MSKTPLWHNRVGILSEAASVRIATPIYHPYGSIGGLGDEIPDNRLSNNNLYPFEEGWRRLRDIIDYEKAATYAILNFYFLSNQPYNPASLTTLYYHAIFFLALTYNSR